MKFWLVSLLVVLIAFATQAAPVGESEHAKVTLRSEAQAITPGEAFDVAFDFELEEDWHIYWKNPGDSGLPTSAHWELPSGFAVGSFRHPTPHRIEVEGLTNYGYEGKVSFLQKMIPPAGLEGEAFSQEGNEVILATKLEWLICKEICIPESVELSLTLPISSKTLRDEARFEARRSTLPMLLEEPSFYEIKDDAIHLQLPIQAHKDSYFFPDVGGVIVHSAAQTLLDVDGVSVLKLTPDTQAIEGALGGVLVSGKNAFQLAAQVGSVAIPDSAKVIEPSSDLSLGVALLFALLGGLLLNIMPCVFPVLSLKALSIVKKAEKASDYVRRQGLSYLAGVVISFLVLGAAMIALKSAGHTLGWGFQLQSPVFVTAMMLVFFVLGLSLAGMFHLPVLMGASAQEAEQDDSLKGSFLTGVLAVLVATPCAVPFMAPAVGYAFSQPTAITLLIMVALGVGLASPYLLLSYFPTLQRFLPKPGAWMNRFKEFMAFPMFASAAWLLWVLAQQVSLDDLALILAATVLIAFFIWVNKGWAKLLAVATFAGLLVLLSTADDAGIVERYKAASQPYSPVTLGELRAQNKPVFVNATAAWCLTCKVNERVALRDDAFLDALESEGITYLIADWTNYDDSITQWLESHGRSGVPLYVYYPKNGATPVILPQLLTTSTVIDILKEK